VVKLHELPREAVRTAHEQTTRELVDVARQENDCHPLTDGYHEAWPNPKYRGPVASSFSEFLEQVLRTRRGLYWLGE
jgi:hypothetical protein